MREEEEELLIQGFYQHKYGARVVPEICVDLKESKIDESSGFDESTDEKSLDDQSPGIPENSKNQPSKNQCRSIKPLNHYFSGYLCYSFAVVTIVYVSYLIKFGHQVSAFPEFYQTLLLTFLYIVFFCFLFDQLKYYLIQKKFHYLYENGEKVLGKIVSENAVRKVVTESSPSKHNHTRFMKAETVTCNVSGKSYVFPREQVLDLQIGDSVWILRDYNDLSSAVPLPAFFVNGFFTFPVSNWTLQFYEERSDCAML